MQLLLTQKKKEYLEGKGQINCLISAYLFELLESKGISTHFRGLYSEDCIAAAKLKIIPLEVVVRNIAEGSLCRETPIKKGSKISPSLIDYYYKDDTLSDPLLTDQRIKLLNIISSAQQLEIENISREVNTVLTNFFSNIDLILVDFKIEFGIDCFGKIILGDEISPDNCRIWDIREKDLNSRILDKDRFRKDLGGVIDAYGEILKRIQGVSSKPRNAVNLTSS